MTITYPISQCKREVEAYELSLSEAQYKYEGHWRMHEGYRHYLNVWYKRLTEATTPAIELNRAIIERWDTASLIRVIETGHNPYMAFAALELLSEDPQVMTGDEIHTAITASLGVRQTFDGAKFIRLLQDELDYRHSNLCPGCGLPYEECDDGGCSPAYLRRT